MLPGEHNQAPRHSALPLPARGQRVGVRGSLQDLCRCDLAASSTPRVPTSPRSRGEVETVPCCAFFDSRSERIAR
jgi:hypothetical protein